MALERTGQCEFAELVTNHVFGNINWHVQLAVMYRDRQADKVRHDCRTTRPGFDWLFVFGSLRGFNFFTRWASQNGPFFNERVMCYPLFLAAARDDHGSSTLVTACLLTLGLLAPWRNWMTTSCCFTFTTTVRVIDRIHDHTANGRTNTAPAHRTSFTDFTQAVFGIADFTHGCTALDVHATYFTRAQTHLSVGAVTGHQDHAGAGGTGHLGTLTWQHFDTVHDGTDRNIADRQAVARLDRRFRTIHHCIA